MISNIDKEIQKLVEEKLEEIDKSGSSSQIEALWQYMNSINDRVRCLEAQKEVKKMTFIDEKMIDEYLSEGYDRERDDKATEEEESEEPPMTCSVCKKVFELDELDIIDGEWMCSDCEKAIGEEDDK